MVHVLRKLLYLLIGLFLVTSEAKSQASWPPSDTLTYSIDTFHYEIFLADYAYILFDPTDDYQLTDFLEKEQPESWQLLKKYQRTTFPSKERPWIKISLQNQLPEQQQWVFDCSFINDSISAYAVWENGQIDTFQVGRLVMPADTRNGSTLLQRYINPYNPIFLDLPVGKSLDLYLKLSPNFSDQIYVNPRIHTVEKMIPYMFNWTQAYVKAFFYSGLLLMFVFYNLMIYIFYRELPNLYLALFTFCFCFPSEYVITTWAIKTWLPNLPFLIYFRVLILTPLIYVFIALFISAYLKTKQYFPRVHLYMQTLQVVGYLYLIFSLSYYFVFDRFIHQGMRDDADTLVLIISGLVFSLMALKLYNVKQANIYFLLAGCLFLLLCQGLFIAFELFAPGLWNTKIWALIFPLSLADIGIFGLICILTLGLGYQSRQTFKEKELLEQKDALKSRFFANISHEFRTPLTLILGPIQQLLEKNTDPAERRMLEIMQRNTQRQLKLVDSLLTLSRLEAGKMQLDLQPFEIVQFLKGLLYAFETLAQQKGVKLVFESEVDQQFVLGDTDKIAIIFNNLLSNAIKYTTQGCQISLHLAEVETFFQITVADTGIGIPADFLPKVFDRFFYAGNLITDQESSGIGLALALEYTKLHAGDMQVSSREGEGSTFTVQLPLEKTRSAPVQQSTPEHIPVLVREEQGHPDALAKAPQKQHLLRLLLVEDHEDVRHFIRQVLQDQYEILEANNGKAGLTLAFEANPDLIVSDVMMPEMDGYEFCKLIKTDLRTSHIPVILLTAKAAPKEKLEGLETGADDYLIKPFDSQELKVRIRNLLDLRQSLRQSFATAVFLKPNDIQANSLDKSFLDQALQVVEANMDNEDFNNDLFATALQISKATLNRKLRALLDQSANDFVKSIRLQRAADLLTQQAGTVSEIAFQTGFRSTAYFIKSFKDYFGVTPGNYQDS